MSDGDGPTAADTEPSRAGEGDAGAGDGAAGLTLEYALDAPPERVWRAIETPSLRERWLPDHPLTDPEHSGSGPGREVRFRMRDDAPPYAETTVTFRVLDGAGGGSILRIVHEAPSDASRTAPMPANDAGTTLMRAA